jgi:ribosomal protein S18 acetylase RimI-like enzyme
MIPDVKIRPYTEHDHDGMLQVVYHLQASEFAHFPRMKSPSDLGPDYVASVLAEVKKHRGTLLVAEADSLVAGYCALLTYCDSGEDYDESFYSYAYVSDLGVRESHRNRGIGAALLHHAEAIARREGLPWLRLSVLAANSAGRRLYQRLGFNEHLIEMEKPL